MNGINAFIERYSPLIENQRREIPVFPNRQFFPNWQVDTLPVYNIPFESHLSAYLKGISAVGGVDAKLLQIMP